MLQRDVDVPSVNTVYIHSVITLLGRPAHQLVTANIESANHVAATKCIQTCRRDQEVELSFRPIVRMGKKCDLSDFDRGMVVGAWQGGLGKSQILLIFWDCQALVCREWCEWHICGQKCVVNERGQRRRARLVDADRKVTVTEITTHYNSGMQKSIFEHRTCQSSKRIGCSRLNK